MNRLKIFFILSFTLLTGFAKAQYLTGPNGVKYFFWRTYNRPQHANIGDLVFVEMMGKTDKDSLVMSSYVQGHSFQIFVPSPSYKGCFYEMLTLMGEGDSAEVSVVADSFFLRSMGSPMPDFITPGSKLKITIKMISIVTKLEYDQRMAEDAKNADADQNTNIQKYIADNKLQMIKTSSGLYYQFPLKGFARRASLGDSVTVHYTGYFLDEKVFDSSIPDDRPITFKVGSEAIIKGWSEALQLMSIRDKILVIIPYQLAYGEKGGGVIPPYTPLIFEIELLDIKK